MRDERYLARLEEAVEQFHTLALMAYMGNCGEQQALRMIRNEAIGLVVRIRHERQELIK